MTVRRFTTIVSLLLVCGGMAGWAGPQLTTIQDMLYKADGTPFNGFLQITWNSFETADYSNIGMQSLTVPITNGVLLVRLAPTAGAQPGASYTVEYNSNGVLQYTETWLVPVSSTPLGLSDVRVASTTTSTGTSTGGSITSPGDTTTPIAESGVTGLVADLAARPVEGMGYGPGAAYIDETGALEAVTGNQTDCVHVDGTSGPCGSPDSTPGFVDAALPAGAIDGVNTVFTLQSAPSPATSLALYRNGVLQTLGDDYTFSGVTIVFAAASAPQPGDIVTASYRTAASSSSSGTITGTLSSGLPLGAIVDANVAADAGIEESKLALNYPTHSNANDPTPDQKAALAGTTGVPSDSNRYVTDQDTRLVAISQTTPHALLSATHTDTAPAAPVRGDLIVAQGTSMPLWARLPLGQANRCLVSNGSDTVWGACLFTGLTAGSIPFIDASGNLTQNNTQLIWNNANRKLSIGNSTGTATAYIYDSQTATGVTGLVVRAGQAQGSNPLEQWLDASGNQLAQVDAQGRFTGAVFKGNSSAGGAAWQDAGSASDPGLVTNGDMWFNTSSQSQKTAEAGQAHPGVRVLCGSVGIATSSTALTQLGTCTIPAGLLYAGDRVEIRFDYSHEGTATGFTFEIHWGGTTLLSRAGSASDMVVAGRADAGIDGSGAHWSTESWGTVLAASFSAGSAGDSIAAPITVALDGRMAAATSDTVTLRNFTVIRYPAQANP
ncbi:MAG: hypothetical protein ABSG25_11495 [Bryobacteraceae bacterium]